MGLFSVCIQKELRMRGDILIDQLARGDHDYYRATAAASGATEPLPGTGHTARITVQDAHIERANIDAEFECRCAHEGVNAARAQIGLDRMAFGGQIPTAIGDDACGHAGIRIEHILEVLGQHLHFKA